ncbi:MAG TPA: site-specific integrase [Bacteroidales bacterium]|nr:site-specific integrase [Bacteroidales bacterium]HPS16879.1 site-specific integrase [Bacteroidales bacterium]
MKRPTFSILFFVKRSRALKNGALPIYARITINGKRAEFVIQKNVDECLWDNDKSCAKGNSKQSKEINDYLDYVKAKILFDKIYMEEHNEALTAFSLRDKYMGIDSKSKTILEIFKEHNEKCKNLMNIDFAPGTVERYNTCYKHIEDFIKLKFKREDLQLNEITPMFISDFEYYLKINRKCCHNTATKYIKNFKKIVRIALANGWMKTNPFSNIKFHLDDVDLAYLTEEELNTMIKKEFKVDRLQQVKDVYLFCCFTGLAFIDVKNLTYEDIEEKNGQLWIKKRRQKTKNWCNVPILAPAMDLMNKYKNNPNCKNNGSVLPVLTNQKMNSYLKEIADICGINKHLSTHTARHTFATTVTLSNHISMEVVSKMLGHSSINMTKKYARVVDDLIKTDMDKIMNKYSMNAPVLN